MLGAAQRADDFVPGIGQVHTDDIDPRRHHLGDGHVGEGEDADHGVPRRGAGAATRGRHRTHPALVDEGHEMEERAEDGQRLRGARAHQAREIGRDGGQEPGKEVAHHPHHRHTEEQVERAPERRKRPPDHGRRPRRHRR